MHVTSYLALRMPWGDLGGLQLVCPQHCRSTLFYPDVRHHGIPSPLFFSSQLQGKPIHAVYLCGYGIDDLATRSPMVGISPSQAPSAV